MDLSTTRQFLVPFLLYLSLILNNFIVNCSLEPVLAQVLFRHGDRSSVDSYPSNPYPESLWPQGYGQLSQDGMLQHYLLGGYFRDRYILGNPYNLLDVHYNRRQIHIQSTDVDRTLMSAYCHLAGMYPPSDNQTWNLNVTWQPIPVHTEPTDTDHLIYMDSECPQYDKLYNESLKSEAVKKEEKENKGLYDFIAAKSGVSRESIANIWKIFDTLLCESLHTALGFTLPPWANKTVMDKLKQLESFSFTLKYNTTAMHRLRGGSLVGKMIENMKNRIAANESQPIRKYYIYSAHDTTVAAFLSAMSVFNHIFPPYAATVIVDLLNDTDTGKYHVQLSYKNDATDPHPLIVPGCSKLCPLEKFTALMEPVIPTNWQSECGLTQHPLTRNEVYIMLIVAVVGLLLVVSFILAIMMWWRRRARDDRIRYSSLNVES